MIEFLLGFILCFIVLYLFSSYFVEVPSPPTYSNSNSGTRVVCDYIMECYNHLEDSISDLDERLDDLYREYFSLKTRLFKDNFEDLEK